MGPYNETHDHNGYKRFQYSALERRTSARVTAPTAQLVDCLRLPGVAGSEGIHSIPLVLDEGEWRNILAPGVLQRAFALQALFADIAYGQNALVSGGMLQETEVQQVLASEGVDYREFRTFWQTQPKDQIRFVYGPDVVRDPTGSWLVLEDNLGCVGGVESAKVVLDTYLRTANVFVDTAIPHTSGLGAAIDAFLHHVGIDTAHGGVYGIPGIPAPPSDARYGYETAWKSKTLEARGIVVTQPEEFFETRVEPASVSAIVNLSGTLGQAYGRLVRSTGHKAVPIFGAPYTGVVA
jgi:hypothetical protein